MILEVRGRIDPIPQLPNEERQQLIDLRIYRLHRLVAVILRAFGNRKVD
jgi:hypothetical protein